MSEILSERIPLELEGTPVSSIMIEKPFTCTQDCTISDVVRMLAENEVSSMPVIDERNHVVGFISDGDVMGAIAQHRAHTIFTGGDASMLYFDDQSLEQRIEDLKDRCVMDFATRKVVCARPDQSIARVAALLAKKKFKKLPVVDDEGKMITGDYNIVNVDFFVEYKISDPVQYLYSSNKPELILRNLIQSQIRNVVGSSSVDAVLTDGKEGIQMQVKELVTEILKEYDIGLTLVDVKIQDAEPPTQEVIEAFKAVETAKQQAETVINDAKAYQNAQLPQAQAQADKLTQNAEYLKQKRINEAVEKVAMFEAMYSEYAQNPAITRTRMYYEAISQVLPGVKLYINTGAQGGDVQMLLPLESLAGTEGGNTK